MCSSDLVRNPHINIVGAPIGTIACYGVILLLNIIWLIKVLKVKLSPLQYILKPVISVAIMAVCSLTVYKFLPFGNKISLVVAICVAAVTYVAGLLIMRTVNEDLVTSIPGMTRFVPILKKLHLIKSEDK